MRTFRIGGWVGTGFILLQTAWGAESASPDVSPSRWVPEQAALCLELTAPEPLLGPLIEPAFARRIAALPAYRKFEPTRQMQDVLGLTRYLEQAGQSDWRGIVRNLTRHGVAFAVGGANRTLLVLSADDRGQLDRVHEAVRQLALGEAQRQGQADRVRSMEYAGVTGWTFDGKEAHALLDRHLLVASDPAVLKAAVDLTSAPAGSLARRADYQAARQAVGPNAAGMLFVDVTALRQAPGFTAALDGARDNPLAALLLAGLPARLKSAPWLAFGIYIEGTDLSVRAFLGAGAEAVKDPAHAVPVDESTPPTPIAAVPRGIAGLSLGRDLGRFYAAKDELFPQRTSGLIFFENMMGIFFSGRNLTDDVLAKTTPQMQVFVARQDYDPAVGTPDPQWPAFAVVFGLREPARFGETLEEAWQKALGLINFTRGQKALPGLILDRVDHRGTRMSIARFSAQDVTNRQHLDSRFNFRPALAISGSRAILSSTDQLARDLLDSFAKPPAPSAKTPAKAHSILELSGAELAAALTASRAALVRDDMLKKGKSQAEAETAIDTLCAAIGWLERATLSVGSERSPAIAELKAAFRQSEPSR